MYLHKYKTMFLHEDQSLHLNYDPSVYLQADPSIYLPDMSKTLFLRRRPGNTSGGSLNLAAKGCKTQTP